ncbi:MAG: hypothetical protein QMD23_01930, partial [Candidatus Bathyarchaeia archaeon]|nr:hypothetical protein [Candidatus Bathyarchaeia archaeon]
SNSLPSTTAFISLLEIFPDLVRCKGTPTKLMYSGWKENSHHKPYLNSNILKLMSKGGEKDEKTTLGTFRRTQKTG